MGLGPKDGMRGLIPARVRKRPLLWLGGLGVLVGAGWWCFDLIPPSTGALEGRVRDKPGVLEVVAEVDNSGENDIPFARIPKLVKVTMEADSTAAEISAVFDAYDDDIDDRDVGSIDLVLGGGKPLALSTGEGVKVTHAEVSELVQAAKDPLVLDYARQAYPVLPTVDARVRANSLREVVAFADLFSRVEPIENVSVSSGGFHLNRDEQWGEPSMQQSRAREQVAIQLDERFGLLGVEIYSEAPMKVIVDRSERRAVERYLERLPGRSDLGKVQVEQL